MATKEQLAIEAAVDLLLKGRLDKHERELIERWSIAWQSVSADLEAALLDLTSAKAGERVTRTDVIRSQRLQAALATLMAALDGVVSSSTRSYGTLAAAVISASTDATESMVKAGLTGALRAELRADVTGASHAQVRAMLERTTQQMTKRTYYLRDEATAAIKQQVLKGIIVGNNPRKAARDAVRGIEDLWNGGLARANTIARTEMIDAHRAAAQHVEEQNTDVLDGWEWSAHLGDKRTCRACLGMHGTRHALDVDGPKGHPNCRCARVPVTKSWADLGFEGMREPANKNVDADEWFNKLSEADQRAILTDKGFEKWKRGDYPRSQWAYRKQNKGWRDSYQPTKP